MDAFPDVSVAMRLEGGPHFLLPSLRKRFRLLSAPRSPLGKTGGKLGKLGWKTGGKLGSGKLGSDTIKP